MKLNNHLFDSILEKALESPRKRMHFDLRTQAGCPVGPGMTENEGSVIFEVKDRPYDPETTEDFL